MRASLRVNCVGTHTNAHGDIDYVGEFQNGSYNGQGIYYRRRGKILNIDYIRTE